MPFFMSQSRQFIARASSKIPNTAIIALVAIFAIGVFVIGFDQGETLSLVYGEDAYKDALFHEFAHDVRHASGFPCH